MTYYDNACPTSSGILQNPCSRAFGYVNCRLGVVCSKRTIELNFHLLYPIKDPPRKGQPPNKGHSSGHLLVYF